MARQFLRKIASQDVKKRTVYEHSYIVPNNETLRITKFIAGHEYSTKECRIELTFDDVIIATIYGPTVDLDIKDSDYLGDGAKAVKIRLVNNDSGNIHMTGIWEGFLL